MVADVPWARHNSSFTREFKDQVPWLAVNCSKNTGEDDNAVRVAFCGLRLLTVSVIKDKLHVISLPG
jgi:hypothetical protein